jgi:hypothetical protein
MRGDDVSQTEAVLQSFEQAQYNHLADIERYLDALDKIRSPMAKPNPDLVRLLPNAANLNGRN